MAEAIQKPAQRRQSRNFILGSLSFGHGISHLYDQGFPVFMPAIQAAMGLSNFQVAFLLGIRQGGFGAVNLIGGAIVDQMKASWGPILTGCMIWAALGFLVLAASPNLGVLVIAVAIVSIPGALWHLPSTAALSRRFPDRRGFAISMHGFGSNLGNVLAPVVAGGLLTFMLWRHILLIYTIPAAIMAVFVWWSLRDLGVEDGEARGQERPKRRILIGYRDGLAMFKSPVVATLVLAAAIRGVANNALFQWTPFYLKNATDGGLDMNYFVAGVHLSLLTGMGIISAPILGYLSDRYGRKQVLVPGLIIAAVLSMFVVSAGESWMLAVLLGGIGLFSFALQQIILAAVLDMTGKGAEATASGLIFGINGVLGFGSPFLAAFIIDDMGGYGSIFYYVGVLTIVSAVIISVIRFPNYRLPKLD
ncbi:MAG: MFS transporter [Chloroflexi bacterium]|nr:MFS transporter [Chloroflexota bacterium]MDA1270360.1 MFS transporter [Chloroflexota bacterium]